MKDAVETKNGKGKGRVKAIKESAFEAGLAAFAALESTDVVPRPVVTTARTLVREGIESIMRAKERGVPLLRIYNDAKKAAGLKIGFQTFVGYVSEAARDKGLRSEKVKTPPRPAASTNAGATKEQAQAPEQAPEQAIMLAEQQNSSWNCDNCQTDSVRHESKSQPGRYFWRCSSCGQVYADDSGVMTDSRL